MRRAARRSLARERPPLPRQRLLALTLWLGALLGACESGTTSVVPIDTDAQAPDGGAPRTGASGVLRDAGTRVPADTGARCDPEAQPRTSLGIASTPLAIMRAEPITERVELLGEGRERTLASEQNALAGLRWQGDRMFMLADTGWWEIPPGGPARWYAMPTALLVLDVRAGDVDGDGDLDAMLLTSELDLTAAARGESPLLTRLSIWERTPDGLHERGDVRRATTVLLPMTHVFGDLDADGDLDIVSFERGAPVGYVHDGAFGFTRSELGAGLPEYADAVVTGVDYADRDHDGAADLLVLAGEALSGDAFVLPGAPDGGFGAPGPTTEIEAALVPHGPAGSGFGIADVTGDGLADVVLQDPQSTRETPMLRLYASIDATTLAAGVELEGLGFELADVDLDGATDIVTTRRDRLTALTELGSGRVEAHDLGLELPMALAPDFVVDPGSGDAPAVAYVLYNPAGCPTCDEGCAGRCIFGSCVGCLSDADCAGGRCQAQACIP